MSVQELIETDEDFERFLENNVDKVICLEVYTEAFGCCTAIGRTLRKAKLDVGGVNIAMAKGPADRITYLQRFRNRSEPIFLFIRKHKLSRAAFGANCFELLRHIREELEALAQAQAAKVEEEKYTVPEVATFEYTQAY